MPRSGRPRDSRPSTDRQRGPRSRPQRGPGDGPPADALTIWTEDGLTQFKIGVIRLAESRSNADLERAARARAAPVEAALTYAYRLDSPESAVWWREWGGYDLEADLLRAAVLARPAVREKLRAFDPKDNDWGVDNPEDYADLLIHAHHAEIEAGDIRRGFGQWFASLPPEARRLFSSDLRRWLKPPAGRG